MASPGKGHKRLRSESVQESYEVPPNAVASTSTLQPTQPSHDMAKPSVSRPVKKRKKPTAGIIYISRLPPGMTPQKVRHLMGRWGDIGKVYAQRKDAPGGYNPDAVRQKRQKHISANFSEAWVEFLDKSIAKTVASMLNAQVIGGKKGDRWRDDIWTMRYLSGFKWEMLGEQIAYEKQAHQARLRAEITRAKTEQSEYLKNVELARTIEKRKAKKAGGDSSLLKVSENTKTLSKGFKQRHAVEKSNLEGQDMDGVLNSIFG
ncbi:hypothetical protein L204_104719 [Cryptococcus depauperatus]|nr:pre-rRNA-processing protein ESF2 [Cryptococcus depauperatus CBS 7855]